MFEKYLICDEGFKNVWQQGQATGFQIKIRIAYYRGIFLSLAEDFAVSVDGEKFAREAIRFSVRDKSYSQDEMRNETNVRWQFPEAATLIIAKAGGLSPGMHEITLTERIRISYAPRPRISTAKKKMTLVG